MSASANLPTGGQIISRVLKAHGINTSAVSCNQPFIANASRTMPR